MTIQTINIQNISGYQSINIPDNLKINDDKVYIKKIGNTLYIIPYHNPWKSMMDSLNKFTPDFMDNRQQPDNQNRDNLD